jgi:uncharacterized membrane protein YkvI
MNNEEYGKIPTTLIWVLIVTSIVGFFALINVAYLIFNIVKVVTNG